MSSINHCLCWHSWGSTDYDHFFCLLAAIHSHKSIHFPSSVKWLGPFAANCCQLIDGQIASWDHLSWPTENRTWAPVIATLSYAPPVFAYIGNLDTSVDFNPPRLDGDSMELPPPSPSPFSQPPATHNTFTQLPRCLWTCWTPLACGFLRGPTRPLPTRSEHKLACALSGTLPGNHSQGQQRCRRRWQNKCYISGTEANKMKAKHLTLIINISEFLFTEYRFTRLSATVYWYLRKPKEKFLAFKPFLSPINGWRLQTVDVFLKNMRKFTVVPPFLTLRFSIHIACSQQWPIQQVNSRFYHKEENK